jgi:subfamily B ATP-binding cassette protein MsbA
VNAVAPDSSAAGDLVIYRRLLKLARPYWKAAAVAVLCMMASAATEPMFPAIMKYLLDNGFKPETKQMAWVIPAGIVMLFVVRAVLSFITNYLMTWIATHLMTDLRRLMFARLLTLPTQIFHTESAGRLITRILNDVNGINQALTNVLIVVVRESLTALALLAYLLYLDWQLTLVTLTVAPTIAIAVKQFGTRIRAASNACLKALQKMSHTVEEAVNANKVVKIYGAQQKVTDRFNADTELFRRAMMKEAVPASAITPITHLAASVAVAIITFMAINNASGQGSATAGGFASFITAMLLLIAPLKQLTTIHPTVQRGLASCASVFELLDMAPEEDGGRSVLRQVRGEVAFDQVEFKYPDTDGLALKGVSFTAYAGQTVALVGGSGGGKSTIGALIPRFYRPTSGCIKIDGFDINALGLADLRSHIALVSQDVVLFNDTVGANIAYGVSHGATREELIAAAQAAHAWEFIQQLPQGLDTTIGEDGAKLSGGQRQRIAIARALLKNAPILILDEATSALDTESERQVQAALATLMQNRTTLVIAHRLSTIEHADQILVLDQGLIVERGTHAELLALGGYYANLNQLQT